MAQVSNGMFTAVAKAYRLPNRGLIQPGCAADLVLVDLSHTHPVLREEIVAKWGLNLFEGWELHK